MNAITTTKFEAFEAEHPAVAAWLIAKQLKSDFAASLLQQARHKGFLSERQVAAVENCIRRDAEFDARQAANAAKPQLDLTALNKVFDVARAHDIKKPMLRLGEFKFKVADPFGNNAGAIWVTRATKNEFGEYEYLGKIKGGVFLGIRTVDAATAAAIERCAANPAEEAKAYGQRTGMCCVCGRTLTKGESIDAMIGPICAGKYGF